MRGRLNRSRPGLQTRISEIGKSARAFSHSSFDDRAFQGAGVKKRHSPSLTRCSALALYPLNALMKDLLMPKAWGTDFKEWLPWVSYGQFQGCRSPLALTTVPQDVPCRPTSLTLVVPKELEQRNNLSFTNFMRP